MDDCEIISSDEEIEIIGECGGDTRLVTILNDAQDVTFDRTNGIRMCREMIHQASKVALPVRLPNYESIQAFVKPFASPFSLA